TEAVRADQARAVCPNECEQPVLAVAALRPHLGEAGGDDTQGAYAGAQHVLGGVEHLRTGDADHREVDDLGQLVDRGGWRPRGDWIGAAVERVSGSLEIGLEDVAEELATDRAAPTRRAEHGNGSRLEERLQRRDHANVVTALDAQGERPGRGDGEAELYLSAAELTNKVAGRVREG